MSTAQEPRISTDRSHWADCNGKGHLPDFGLLYFDLLIAEYESIRDRPCHDSEANRLARELVMVYRSCPKVLTWGDLCEFDKLILRLRTTAEIRERIPALESRYLEIADPSRYADYLRAFPISQVDASEERVRARMDTLMSEFYRFCTVAECRERLRDRASRRLVYCIETLLVIFVISGFVNVIIHPLPKPLTTSAIQGQVSTSASSPADELPPVLILSRFTGTAIAVIFAGALGGFISAQRRVRSKARRTTLIDLITLSQEGPSHSAAPITGGVFALVLFTMFAAQLISGPLFPSITTPPGVRDSFLRFWDFFLLCGPEKGIDWAKVLVWSFIAGFAERFVPDALTRLAATGAEQKRE